MRGMRSLENKWPKRSYQLEFFSPAIGVGFEEFIFGRTLSVGGTISTKVLPSESSSSHKHNFAKHLHRNDNSDDDYLSFARYAYYSQEFTYWNYRTAKSSPLSLSDLKKLTNESHIYRLGSKFLGEGTLYIGDSSRRIRPFVTIGFGIASVKVVEYDRFLEKIFEASNGSEIADYYRYSKQERHQNKIAFLRNCGGGVSMTLNSKSSLRFSVELSTMVTSANASTWRVTDDSGKTIRYGGEQMNLKDNRFFFLITFTHTLD